MKKYLFLLTILTIATGNNLITQSHVNNYNINNKLNLIDLNTIITTTNLGPIEMAGSAPVKTELLTALQAKNPEASNLKTTDFIFKDTATASDVTIIGIGDYTGEINIYYSKKDMRIDLSSIITTTNLEDIAISNILPSKEELLIAIKTKNSTANNLTINDFVLADLPSLTNVKIIGIDNYKGEINLQYSKKDMRIDLSTIIDITNLDQITISGELITSTELLSAIQAKNPKAKDLTTADFGLDDNPTDSNVIIVGIGNYKGIVALTYTINRI